MPVSAFPNASSPPISNGASSGSIHRSSYFFEALGTSAKQQNRGNICLSLSGERDIEDTRLLIRAKTGTSIRT